MKPRPTIAAAIVENSAKAHNTEQECSYVYPYAQAEHEKRGSPTKAKAYRQSKIQRSASTPGAVLREIRNISHSLCHNIGSSQQGVMRNTLRRVVNRNHELDR
ncbi:hypothetical protein TWF281_004204 [Arthrobotrys megalospora]